MSDLRKAAEMALAKLDHLWEIAVDERMGTDVLPEIQALRQALAQPEWVGLTEDEFYEATKIPRNSALPMHMLKAIEAKLKEKNT